MDVSLIAQQPTVVIPTEAIITALGALVTGIISIMTWAAKRLVKAHEQFLDGTKELLTKTLESTITQEADVQAIKETQGAILTSLDALKEEQEDLVEQYKEPVVGNHFWTTPLMKARLAEMKVIRSASKRLLKKWREDGTLSSDTESLLNDAIDELEKAATTDILRALKS